jgi:hypothetical protein
VVGREREHRLLAQPEGVERLEEAGEERLGRALDRAGVPVAQRLERRRVAGLDPLDDRVLRGEPFLSLGVEDVVRHVRRPAVEPEHERLRAMRSQPLDDTVEGLARAGDVRVGEALEEVVLVEDEAARGVPVRRGDGEQRRDRGVERRVPVEVAVVMGVEPRDHRRRRRARPRGGGDRLVEADSAGGELVDRRRVHPARPVAADVVRPERVGDIDD